MSLLQPKSKAKTTVVKRRALITYSTKNMTGQKTALLLIPRK